MKTIGIDIGTTTISLVCAAAGKIIEARTLENDSSLPANYPGERLQNPQRIEEIVRATLDEMLAAHPDTARIGLTGQMHGILYIDQEGRALSPLYTWQDQQGNLPLPDGKTMVQQIREETGIQAASGYGLVTHLCLRAAHRIPQNAASLCTIPDYISLRLTGRTTPLMHASMAASLGLYDVQNHAFYPEALETLGIDSAILPPATDHIEIIGEYRGIPVTAAIGDNQASFLGSFLSSTGLREGLPLINIGTGGQISVMSDRYIETPGIEIRPLLGNHYLYVGASLCGGRAYAALEKFFREYAEAVTGRAESQYEIMQNLASRAASTTLQVNTQFQGTRAHPEERGSILGISEDNLTPADLILGVLQGIARELFDMYHTIRTQTGLQSDTIIGSGNALRLNPVLQRTVEETFEAHLIIPDIREEAACGAAITAAQ